MSDFPVVVGTDGSAGALDAVEWAADEAARRGVPLRLVHVSVWGQTSRGELADSVTEAAYERAVERRPDVKVSTDVVLGAPVPALITQSDRAGMLVLGSRGLGRVATALLGSVSLPVIAEAVCPVVVVRQAADESASGEGEVLVGVGGHGRAAPAVRFAFEEATARGCPVRAVHAWRVPRVEAPTAHTGQFDDARRARAADATEALDEAVREAVAEFPAVPLHRTVAEAPAAEALLEAAGNAAVAVVGAHHRHAVGTRLGAVDHALLHHAPCPVAVVPLV